MQLFEHGWNKFQKDHLLTEVSFDTAEQFKARMKTGADLALDERIAFPFISIGQLGRILEGEEGQFYARAGSLAETALCQRLVEAEAGYLRDKSINPHEFIGASIFPSGMNAITTTLEHVIENISRTMRCGMRFLRGKTLYYNSNNVFSALEERYNLAHTITVDTTKPNEVETYLKDYQGGIIAIFYETATNPLIEYTDTRTIYKLAHRRNVPIIVDNTFLTPYLLQPMRIGADVVIHSMTKYFNGLGNFLAGAAIGPIKFVKEMRTSQTDFGNVFQSPAIAKLFYDQLASLDERMKLYVKNAREIAAALQSTRMLKPKIEKVLYPEIKDTRYNSAGGVLSFILKGKDDQEKIFREARLMQYCARLRGSSDKIAYSVGFGDNQYRVFGENTWNEAAAATKNHIPGLVRLATGTSNAEYIIPFLRTALDYTYQLKQLRKSE